MTHQPPRIDVRSARREVTSGDALLVCAYDDDAKCRSMLFEGALTWDEFEARRSEVSSDDEIILYCA